MWETSFVTKYHEALVNGINTLCMATLEKRVLDISLWFRAQKLLIDSAQ
jgi:hypothetical protein